jgi:hypothetical protein
MFNFGISKESAVKTIRPQLKPWNIYDVKFMGCEVREFAGKKNPNETYKVLDIKFENEDGYFTVTKFFPKAGDDVRREVDAKNGGKRELASNFEELMNIVKQTAEVLNPEGFKKMSELSSKFKSFDDVAKTLIAVTDKVKGCETKIKLIGRNRDNRVVAEIPNITSVFDGVATITDNYIGSKLFFSDYEEGRRSDYLKSKPTEMKSTSAVAVDSLMDTEDIGDLPTGDEFDLDNLL